MEQGYAPQDIIDWLVENDAQNDPTIRQYGIVDLLEGGGALLSQEKTALISKDIRLETHMQFKEIFYLANQYLMIWKKHF